MIRSEIFPAVWLACAVFLLGKGVAAELSKIEDVRSLRREAASSGLTVRIRGVVTWCSSRDTFAIQDGSAGIWIKLDEARKRQLWRGGDTIPGTIREGLEVEIEGVTDPGGYAPLVLPETLRILGTKPLPPASPMQPARFFSGADDSQRIEVRGVVLGFHPWANGVTLVMDANPGRFTAQVSRAVWRDPSALVDAEILLRGVAATRFNTRGEATGSRVVVSVPGDLVVEKPPPSPDHVPSVTLDRLLPFRTSPPGPHRVRVEGTVTFALPGSFFYLQDGSSAIRVETTSQVVLAAGDRVEAAGFVDISRLIATLGDATVRKLGAASVPEPVFISPEEVIALNHESITSGQVAQPHDHDGHLIRCRARLLAVQTQPDKPTLTTLTLESSKGRGQEKLIFQAFLHDDHARSTESLRAGSELELTGLVQLEYDPREFPMQAARTIPASLSLTLRNAADLVVIREPSWWTAERFTAVMAAVLVALGAALVWSLQLKNQVRRKSKLLAREISARRDAALEFRSTMRERNRLAANLHDTLPQTMSAISLQLDACEFSLRRQGIESLPPLEMVREMVGFAVKELRGAVWEMRSFSLRGRSFPAALQAVVDRVGSGHPAEIQVRTEGPLEQIPEFVAGNLLLIVQEALHNARHHGHPSHLSVSVSTLALGAPIQLEVTDDGCGFTPGEQKGHEQGHHGLVGMRERAERLGGWLRMESAPGRGTRILAEVSQHVDDEELEDPP